MQNTLTPEYLCNLGLIHYEEREFDQSLQYFQSALRIYYGSCNHKGIVTCLMNIALVYDERNDYETAFSHLTQALSIANDKLWNSNRHKEVLEIYHTVQNHLTRLVEQNILKLMLENRVNVAEILRLGDEALEKNHRYTASFYYNRAEKLAYFLHDAVALAEIFQHRNTKYTDSPNPSANFSIA